MAEASEPRNYEALVRGFAQTVEKLRELEQQASSVDPSLGGNEMFRDPARLEEATVFVEQALAGGVPPAVPCCFTLLARKATPERSPIDHGSATSPSSRSIAPWVTLGSPATRSVMICAPSGSSATTCRL